MKGRETVTSPKSPLSLMTPIQNDIIIVYLYHCHLVFQPLHTKNSLESLEHFFLFTEIMIHKVWATDQPKFGDHKANGP